ncbi:hypothetical protein NST63_27650 [Heyndrickxia sp. FSL W8-0496]|uniref:hypothetical protein n=1 Tax=Heyndrickxia sp. FSL W8-0496 TaxID=2954702 RepID=UPI0030F8914B
MKKALAILMPNTVDSDFSTWEEINENQKKLKQPAVIFVDRETKEVLKVFSIVADDFNDLHTMWNKKTFFTDSLVDGEYLKISGAFFVGTKEKVRTAATERTLK